jgi:cell division protein FtsA
MEKEVKDGIVAGLDLGTTKTCAIIGEQDDEGLVHIIGVGTTPSTGLKKGAVVNIEQTIQSIHKAVQDAERMAGVQVGSVYAGINGGHIKGINSRGVIAVSRRDKEITEDDGCASSRPPRHRDPARPPDHPGHPAGIHRGRPGRHQEPRGHVGGASRERGAHRHGAVTSVQNIVRSVERAGLGVSDIILQPLASAEAILSADEKELGVVLLDIGGGTTDIAVFINGSLMHTGIITLGGQLVTNDVAVALRTPTARPSRSSSSAVAP